MSAFPQGPKGPVFAAMLLLSAYAPVAQAGSSELPVSVGNTDHEIGDRVRIRSKIMRVDAGKQDPCWSRKRRCGSWSTIRRFAT